MSTFAHDLRPQTLDEIVGQSHIITFLIELINKKLKISLLFYGKPGGGKTSLAYALCNDLKVSYAYFNAATGSKAQLKELISFNDYLIIDELHRLNKDKQDLLLPALEFGRIKIIATTTENPFFVVNPAVRSRLHIFELKDLTLSEMVNGLKKVLKKQKAEINISDSLLTYIAKHANGDYRYCLNIIFLLIKLYPQQKITKVILQKIMPTIHFYSDKKGDGHYDLLSAFHKSLRGSDVNASLYYLAQLINSGDILGMERRMTMVAYEDVGMADPNLALRINSGFNAIKKVGFPEAKIILSALVIDLCKSKKSNSAKVAIDNALTQIQKAVFPMPKHLQDAHYASAKKLKRGQNYLYPHDYGGYVKQQYLPDEIKDMTFYVKNKNDKK